MLAEDTEQLERSPEKKRNQEMHTQEKCTTKLGDRRLNRVMQLDSGLEATRTLQQTRPPFEHSLSQGGNEVVRGLKLNACRNPSAYREQLPGRLLLGRLHVGARPSPDDPVLRADADGAHVLGLAFVPRHLLELRDRLCI